MKAGGSNLHALLFDVAGNALAFQALASDRRGKRPATGINDEIARLREIAHELLERLNRLLPIVVCLLFSLDIDHITNWGCIREYDVPLGVDQHGTTLGD